jgi:phosphotransferase system  glucose/maltose/N-acetylglucosamine-specific IIC component
MKLSPNTKLNIVFWSITAPVVPFVILLLLVGILIALIPPFRNWSLNGIEKVIQKFANWRNNLPIVKNAYDKAHLFDYIKG